MNSRIKSVVIIFIAGSLLWCLLGSVVAPYPVFYSPSKIEKPDYISFIWPPPDSSIWIGYYYLSMVIENPFETARFGISVEITGAELMIQELPYPESATMPPFEDRVSLYVDGELAQRPSIFSGGALTIDDYYPPLIGAFYRFHWAPQLGWGSHTAKLVILTKAEHILVYEWHFRIR